MKRVKPQPPPRYDEVFYTGVKWLEDLPDDDWVTRYRRLHPFRWHYAKTCLAIEMKWAWLMDKPNCDGVGLRTGKPR